MPGVSAAQASRRFASSGKYIEVKRPERLVFTWAHHADGDFGKPRGHETTVRIEFRAVGKQDRDDADPGRVRR